MHFIDLLQSQKEICDDSTQKLAQNPKPDLETPTTKLQSKTPGKKRTIVYSLQKDHT